MSTAGAEQLRLVAVNMHSHNRFSKDNASDPAKMVEGCKRTGVRVLAVTNHNTIDGIKETEDAS